MEQYFVSSNPILLLVALILTFMASYTSLDLLTLLRSSENHKKFLLIGGSFSMGIAIWTFNFFGILAFEKNSVVTYNLSVMVLSLVLGVALASMGFMALTVRKLSFINIVHCGTLLTVSLLSNYIIGLYALNLSIEIHTVLLMMTVMITLIIFIVAFLLFFYSNYRQKENQIWLKPTSTFIVSAAIIQGHFMLVRALPVKQSVENVNELVRDTSFVPFLVLFVFLLIVGGLITSSSIITKRLQNSDKYVQDYRYALDQASIVAVTDSKGKIIYVNEKFTEISQYKEEELLGKNHSIINSGYHSKEFFQDLWNTILGGRTWKGEICNQAKDGSLYWVSTTIVPFLNKKGKPYQFVSIRNDITERKQTEELLHRQDKLTAVGQLAAGVAHEIRNPLTSMRGYAEFLQLDETKPERLEYFDIILDEIERVNTIVEEFMVLAKPQTVHLELKNIVLIVQDVLTLVEFEAKNKNVYVHFESQNQEIYVNCDENRLKQVLLNFAKNGIEAMPSGGDLYVNASQQGGKVMIHIRDTGVGIPSEKLNKLGEPFFTTKEQGNGLGLMVSYKIIEGHKGKIEVVSEVNEGSTFIIKLPTVTV
ncbi:ATP-binding protein [Peribacillus loiseleuriae]|uniref:ATP-binding protein n=1 Tax=Peribacillus loiseleuriae TaxID=1679170 RepID=UPI001FE07AD1|nr:ATP-binding protein [Peribacillus loiseleuriae]